MGGRRRSRWRSGRRARWRRAWWRRRWHTRRACVGSGQRSRSNGDATFGGGRWRRGSRVGVSIRAAGTCVAIDTALGRERRRTCSRALREVELRRLHRGEMRSSLNCFGRHGYFACEVAPESWGLHRR
eukprot:3471752-Pleurochrysis_carterae.AAC.1